MHVWYGNGRVCVQMDVHTYIPSLGGGGVRARFTHPNYILITPRQWILVPCIDLHGVQLRETA